MKFYDTCSVLALEDQAFTEHFVISSQTISELESIKTSQNKSEEVKYKARQVCRLLNDNEGQYDVVLVTNETIDIVNQFNIPPTPDNLIIACCYIYCQEHSETVFVSEDILCRIMASKIFNLSVEAINQKERLEYDGYKIITLDEDLMTVFYSNLTENKYDCLNNEYLMIQNLEGEFVDICRWNGSSYVSDIKKATLNSSLFNVKPNDVYQQIAIDSMMRNKITMLNGSAGTGKTYLAMAFLFNRLEKGKISKVIIFCNTVPTLHSAKLGYYPGSKDEKLLDSQIGNMLSGKFGDIEQAWRYIREGKLLLLPMCDIRGYDTSGMKAGIYIPEAQNMDVPLMKLALQRIGDDCICVIDGDFSAQVDDVSFAGSRNGMRRASEVFRGTSIYGEVMLKTIYRSDIARIAERM